MRGHKLADGSRGRHGLHADSAVERRLTRPLRLTQNTQYEKQHPTTHLQIAPTAVAPSMQTRASSELTITPATLSPLPTPAARSARTHLKVKTNTGGTTSGRTGYHQRSTNRKHTLTAPLLPSSPVVAAPFMGGRPGVTRSRRTGTKPSHGRQDERTRRTKYAASGPTGGDAAVNIQARGSQSACADLNGKVPPYNGKLWQKLAANILLRTRNTRK